jgi:hypothetical protein
MSLYRAEKLIDLACSTTHDEEARTAALAACRLIRKHGLRLTADPLRPSARGARHEHDPRGARREPAPAPRHAEPAREKPPNGGAWSEAHRSTRCESCGSRIAAGDEVYVVAGTTWCARH